MAVQLHLQASINSGSRTKITNSGHRPQPSIQSIISVEYDVPTSFVESTSRSSFMETLLSEETRVTWYTLSKSKKTIFIFKFILFLISFISYCCSYHSITRHCTTNCSAINCQTFCESSTFIFIAIVLLILSITTPSFVKLTKDMERAKEEREVKEIGNCSTLCKFKTCQFISIFIRICAQSFMSYYERIILYSNIKKVSENNNVFNQIVCITFLFLVVLGLGVTLVLVISYEKCKTEYKSEIIDVFIALRLIGSYTYINAVILYALYWLYIAFVLSDKVFESMDWKWKFGFDETLMMDISIIASLSKHGVSLLESIMCDVMTV